MGAETSDPGGQDTVDQMEEENAIAGMTDEQSQAQMSEAGLASGFGDYAGSTSLSQQQKGSITGSKITDALVPGVGVLSIVSSLNAGYLQQSLQRGASPVYGARGTVEGVVNTTQAFGTEFKTYSGNPDLDPIGGSNQGSDDNSSGQIISPQVNKAVSAPSAPAASGGGVNPNDVVYGNQTKTKKGKGRRSGTILTSAQGDTSQLTTILKPGLKGSLG